MELKSNSPPPPAKSKFTIDSILQLSTTTPAANRQPAWSTVPQARIRYLQQQKAVLALALQQQRHQQERSNQHLQFIFARQPFPSIGALQQPIRIPPPATASIVSSAPIVAYTQQHGHKQAGQPQMDSIHAQRQEQARLRSPPEMSAQQDLDASSPRRRRSSVTSTGVSNDSDEDHDTTPDMVECSSLSSKFLNPNAKMASPHSREIAFKKSRTSFTKGQIHKLEVKFDEQKYLTKLDRTQLAQELGLTEKHVKTWFQNRRTKWKKDCSDVDWSKHKEMAATLMYNQYLENKNHITEEAASC